MELSFKLLEHTAIFLAVLQALACISSRRCPLTAQCRAEPEKALGLVEPHQVPMDGISPTTLVCSSHLLTLTAWYTYTAASEDLYQWFLMAAQRQRRTVSTAAGHIPQQRLGKHLPRAHKRGNDYSSQLLGNHREIAAPCPITVLQERQPTLHQDSQNFTSSIGLFCRIFVLLCSREQAEAIWDYPWAVHTQEYLPASSAQMHQQLLAWDPLATVALSSQHSSASSLNLFWLCTLPMSLLLQTNHFHWALWTLHLFI